VEFFLEREAAVAMIDEVRDDEPLLAEGLRIEAIELRETTSLQDALCKRTVAAGADDASSWASNRSHVYSPEPIERE
jgi:hypothetical protein